MFCFKYHCDKKWWNVLTSSTNWATAFAGRTRTCDTGINSACSSNLHSQWICVVIIFPHPSSGHLLPTGEGIESHLAFWERSLELTSGWGVHTLPRQRLMKRFPALPTELRLPYTIVGQQAGFEPATWATKMHVVPSAFGRMCFSRC